MRPLLPTFTLLCALSIAAAEPVGSQADLEHRLTRFVPVELGQDLSSLSERDRQALARIVRAAKVMDPLYLSQVWGGNPSMLMELARDTSPLGLTRLHFFILNMGPWDRIDGNRPCLPNAPPKPPGASFYPPGMSKAQIEHWLKGLAPAERQRATGYFTVLRADPKGKLAIVPYSVAYQEPLAESAGFLREAAAYADDPTLKRYLLARADAFRSNDYYASDLDWLKLKGNIETELGPYDVYDDQWFNDKASFQAYVAIVDAKETERLSTLSSHLQQVEDHLPIDPRYRNPRLGALAPIRVVNSVFSAGDGNHSVQTAAFNLPNDERITQEKGTKRVMLRNVQQAKFRAVLLPIADAALTPEQRPQVDFDAFFTYILMHELMHGLGPHQIHVHGRSSTVHAELQDTFSSIEESKADISGLFAMRYLIDHGVLPPQLGQTVYVTYLATIFRGIRFGVSDAHGKGMAMELNFLMDHGGIALTPTGRFTVVREKIAPAIEVLAHELLTVEAEGDRDRAQRMLDSLGVIRPPVQRVLDSLAAVPVDIEPRYTTAEALLRANP